MSNQQHTPEPWVSQGRMIKRDNGFGYGEVVANVPGGNTSGPFFVESDEECAANARRIVACVNVCSGISTEVLELNATAGGVAELERQRDEAKSQSEWLMREVAGLQELREGQEQEIHKMVNLTANAENQLAEALNQSEELLEALEGLLKASTGEGVTATEVGTAHHQAIIAITKAKGANLPTRHLTEKFKFEPAAVGGHEFVFVPTSSPSTVYLDEVKQLHGKTIAELKQDGHLGGAE